MLPWRPMLLPLLRQLPLLLPSQLLVPMLPPQLPLR
jgi:hypothetical protein